MSEDVVTSVDSDVRNSESEFIEVDEVKKISPEDQSNIKDSQKKLQDLSNLFERAAAAARIAELELENANSQHMVLLQSIYLKYKIDPSMNIDNGTGEIITKEESAARNEVNK